MYDIIKVKIWRNQYFKGIKYFLSTKKKNENLENSENPVRKKKKNTLVYMSQCFETLKQNELGHRNARTANLHVKNFHQ